MAEQPQKIGPYEVTSLIGEGAMGTVYKAVNPVGGGPVAIKVLREQFVEDAEAVERFHREAEAVSRLRHPNLVRIIEKEHGNGDLYFVMEYVAGTTLETVLRRRRLSLREAFIVFKKVCSGLEAAHQKEIVHRDLSPRNILVSEDFETVKIVDFGISRVESISAEMGTLSTSQVSLGSLHYMAPEQAVDMRNTDHRADIYSLGVLFYEMLTGRVPVGRYSLPSAVNSEVPSEVDPVVLRCLQSNPAKRFSSVSGLLARVKRLDDQLRLGLVSELKDISRSTSKIFLKSSRNRATKWGLTAAALVVAAAATGYLLWQRSADPGAAAATADTAVEAAEPAATGSADFLRVDPTARDAPGDEGEALDLEGLAPPVAESEEELEEAEEPDRPAVAAEPVAAPAVQAPAVDSPPRPTQKARQDLDAVRTKVDNGLYEPALQDLEALLAGGGGGATIATALLLKGEIHSKMGDPRAARSAWVELGSRFRGSDAAAEGSYRVAALENAERGRSEPREVWKAYNTTIATYPRTTWAAKALMDRAELEKAEKWRIADERLGVKVPMALITYRQMTGGFPTASGAERAFFELAEMYEDLKRFDLAAAAFEGLATRFPDSRRDAWWRLAQLYDSRRLSDSAKAIAAYEKVPAGSRHHADAQKRLARLKR